MKLPKFTPPLIGLLLGAVFWSCVVCFAWVAYQQPPYDWEGAGFMLAILGTPSTMLVAFYDGSIFMQILLMSLLGYLQWPALGYFIGRYMRRRLEREKLKYDKS